METRKRTPLELFNLPQHFVVPLFQRPYVWEEADQWSPLWKDILRAVEKRIATPSTPSSHFLGAVVLQAAGGAPGTLPNWNVIDGQQRLTTLQLLMDAAHSVLDEHGEMRVASKLEGLTHNLSHFVSEGDSPLKLRHLNKDRGAFDEVMNAAPGFDYAELHHRTSRITRAHAYFKSTITTWLGDPAVPDFHFRAEQLTEVLQHGLQLVTIDLTPEEDSQEIFETLNARGTPLTASDLVRNFVFQRLAAEGGDSKRAYERDWPFESKFWETEVSVGRHLVSRSSLFLNQWLVSRLGEEVSPPTTFSAFKSYVAHSDDITVSKLLPKLKLQADQYQAWTEAASSPDGNLTSPEMAFYRMRASGIELLKPLIIWLADPERNLQNNTIDLIIRASESWVYRRQLLRLSNGDLGRVVVEIIRAYGGASETVLAERIVAHLSRLNATSTYWPGDTEIRNTLINEPAYRRYPRARLRMFLESIENLYRNSTKQPQVQRGKLPIEHILPQKWQEFWPVESAEAEDFRAAHVHRLGNLTLLTTSLNAKVSNSRWLSKREELLRHNTVTLTGRVVLMTENRTWNETIIDERSFELTNALMQVWPVPAGHTGTVVDPHQKSADWVELKHLLHAGLLSVGEVLTAVHRDHAGKTASVGADGFLEMDGTRFATLSAAGRHLRNSSTNGWYFWTLSDGRRLKELRSEFVARGNMGS